MATCYKKVNLKGPEWDKASDHVKDLIVQMLAKNPIKRPCIEQVRQHPWF